MHQQRLEYSSIPPNWVQIVKLGRRGQTLDAEHMDVEGPWRLLDHLHCLPASAARTHISKFGLNASA